MIVKRKILLEYAFMHLLNLRFEEKCREVVAACRIASMYYWETCVMGGRSLGNASMRNG